jgi:hypothetical protein
MNISFLSIRKSIAHFVGRYHVVLFVVVVLGGLSLVILRLNNVIVSSSESDGYAPKSSNANFDQATIDRIKQLKTRDEAGAQLDLSKGRTNPFVE